MTTKLRWAAIAALLIKISLALFTTGTNDSITWDRDVAKLRSAGAAELYREGVQFPGRNGILEQPQKFIHPPEVLRGLQLLGILHDKTGLPPHVWLRVFCAFADAGTLTLLWLMFPGPAYRAALILVALSPVSILVSGFHGNTDPIMMCFVAMSVWQMKKGRLAWSGAAFGISLGVKLAPVIFVPTLLLAISGSRNRLKWIVAAILVWTGAGLPWLIQSPELILRTIFGYSGSTGWWGFQLWAGILKIWGYPMWYELYSPYSKWLALAAVTVVPVIFRLWGVRIGLFAQCGLIASLFLFVSPAFGLQYLAWTVPWLIVLAPRVIVPYYALTSAFMLMVYGVAASAGGPKLYADLLTGDRGVLIGMGVICWMGMGLMIRSYFHLAVRPDGIPGASRESVEVCAVQRRETDSSA